MRGLVMLAGLIVLVRWLSLVGLAAAANAVLVTVVVWEHWLRMRRRRRGAG